MPRKRRRKKSAARYWLPATRLTRLHNYMVNVAAVLVLVLLAVSVRNALMGRSVRIRPSDAAALRAPAQAVQLLYDMSAESGQDFAEVLAVYMLDNGFFKKAAEPLATERLVEVYINKHDKLLNAFGGKTVSPYAAFLRQLSEEIDCFPVMGDNVMFGDSFGAARSTGTYNAIDVFDKLREPGRLRVLAVAGGEVIEVGRNAREGFFVAIRSASGATYRYAHLDYISADVYTGGKIMSGAPLGYMGDTGSDGKNDLFPVRLSVSVQVENPLFSAPTYINPYIFLCLVENGG